MDEALVNVGPQFLKKNVNKKFGLYLESFNSSKKPLLFSQWH